MDWSSALASLGLDSSSLSPASGLEDSLASVVEKCRQAEAWLNGLGDGVGGARGVKRRGAIAKEAGNKRSRTSESRTSKRVVVVQADKVGSIDKGVEENRNTSKLRPSRSVHLLNLGRKKFGNNNIDNSNSSSGHSSTEEPQRRGEAKNDEHGDATALLLGQIESGVNSITEDVFASLDAPENVDSEVGEKRPVMDRLILHLLKLHLRALTHAANVSDLQLVALARACVVSIMRLLKKEENGEKKSVENIIMKNFVVGVDVVDKRVTSRTNHRAKIIDYKLQVLYRVETYWLLSDSDIQTSFEASIVDYLRRIMICESAMAMNAFLQDVLLLICLDRQSSLLAFVFDELNVVRPKALANIFSPFKTLTSPNSSLKGEGSTSDADKERNLVSLLPLSAKKEPRGKIEKLMKRIQGFDNTKRREINLGNNKNAAKTKRSKRGTHVSEDVAENRVEPMRLRSASKNVEDKPTDSSNKRRASRVKRNLTFDAEFENSTTGIIDGKKSKEERTLPVTPSKSPRRIRLQSCPLSTQGDVFVPETPASKGFLNSSEVFRAVQETPDVDERKRTATNNLLLSPLAPTVAARTAFYSSNSDVRVVDVSSTFGNSQRYRGIPRKAINDDDEVDPERILFPHLFDISDHEGVVDKPSSTYSLVKSTSRQTPMKRAEDNDLLDSEFMSPSRRVKFNLNPQPRSQRGSQPSASKGILKTPGKEGYQILRETRISAVKKIISFDDERNAESSLCEQANGFKYGNSDADALKKSKTLDISQHFRKSTSHSEDTSVTIYSEQSKSKNLGPIKPRHELNEKKGFEGVSITNSMTPRKSGKREHRDKNESHDRRRVSAKLLTFSEDDNIADSHLSRCRNENENETHFTSMNRRRSRRLSGNALRNTNQEAYTTPVKANKKPLEVTLPTSSPLKDSPTVPQSKSDSQSINSKPNSISMNLAQEDVCNMEDSSVARRLSGDDVRSPAELDIVDVPSPVSSVIVMKPRRSRRLSENSQGSDITHVHVSPPRKNGSDVSDIKSNVSLNESSLEKESCSDTISDDSMKRNEVDYPDSSDASILRQLTPKQLKRTNSKGRRNYHFPPSSSVSMSGEQSQMDKDASGVEVYEDGEGENDVNDPKARKNTTKDSKKEACAARDEENKLSISLDSSPSDPKSARKRQAKSYKLQTVIDCESSEAMEQQSDLSLHNSTLSEEQSTSLMERVPVVALRDIRSVIKASSNQEKTAIFSDDDECVPLKKSLKGKKKRKGGKEFRTEARSTERVAASVRSEEGHLIESPSLPLKEEGNVSNSNEESTSEKKSAQIEVEKVDTDVSQRSRPQRTKSVVSRFGIDNITLQEALISPRTKKKTQTSTIASTTTRAKEEQPSVEKHSQKVIDKQSEVEHRNEVDDGARIDAEEESEEDVETEDEDGAKRGLPTSSPPTSPSWEVSHMTSSPQGGVLLKLNRQTSTSKRSATEASSTSSSQVPTNSEPLSNQVDCLHQRVLRRTTNELGMSPNRLQRLISRTKSPETSKKVPKEKKDEETEKYNTTLSSMSLYNLTKSPLLNVSSVPAKERKGKRVNKKLSYLS